MLFLITILKSDLECLPCILANRKLAFASFHMNWKRDAALLGDFFRSAVAQPYRFVVVRATTPLWATKAGRCDAPREPGQCRVALLRARCLQHSDSNSSPIPINPYSVSLPAGRLPRGESIMESGLPSRPNIPRYFLGGGGPAQFHSRSKKRAAIACHLRVDHG